MTRIQKAEFRKINLEAVAGTAVFLAFMVIGITLWSIIS